MIYYSYEKFVDNVKSLVKLTHDYNPDTLIAVARGGLTPGHAYASSTNNRQLMSINFILYDVTRSTAGADERVKTPKEYT